MKGIGKVKVCRTNDISQKNPFLKTIINSIANMWSIESMHYGKMKGIGKVQVCRSNDIYQKNPFLKSKLFYKTHFIYKLELFLQI